MYSKITGDHVCVQRYYTDKENKSTIMYFLRQPFGYAMFEWIRHHHTYYTILLLVYPKYSRLIYTTMRLMCMFSYSIYLAEFSENGGAYHWADTQCFRASTITDATGVFSILLYIIFLIIILVMTVKLGNKFRHDGFKKTLTSFWNVLDMVLCVFSYTGTVIWVFKYAPFCKTRATSVSLLL
jgi:hypothetical protein